MWIARRVVSILTLCGLAALAWYSLLFARADAAFRGNNLPALRTAVRLVPGNADYHALLAEYLETAGADPDGELAIATDLSPHESRFWIRRSFRAEMERKYADSERYLQQAYRVDKGFDPRWALMNYYFRRGNIPEFWRWTQEALDMSYGGLDPLFRLCLTVDSDPSITRKALPPRPAILFAFFSYLVKNQQIGSAAPIAVEAASTARQEDVPVLIDYCSRQLGHDNESSLAVWNTLCRRGLLRFRELAPRKGDILTNGDFAVAPLQRGFDWKYGTDAGVSIGPMDAAQGISIDIGGKQPETAWLMEQTIPLTPDKRYVLNYEYRLITAQPVSGLQWLILAAGTAAGAAPRAEDTSPGDPIAASSILSATDWNTGQMTFSSGRRNAARLALRYRRVPGTVTWTGTVQIRHVTSGLAEPGQAEHVLPGSGTPQ